MQTDREILLIMYGVLISQTSVISDRDVRKKLIDLLEEQLFSTKEMIKIKEEKHENDDDSFGL